MFMPNPVQPERSPGQRQGSQYKVAERVWIVVNFSKN